MNTIKREEWKNNWNLFFSSLAHAEKAAANQCRKISTLLESTDHSLADKYSGFALDEDQHFALAKDICQPLEVPTEMAQKVYRGDLMTDNASILERTAIIHLVFEPSALAFLGMLKQNVYLFAEDEKFAARVEKCFGDILRDEVGHVYEGKLLVQERLRHSSEREIRETKRSIRRHRAFLKVGLKSFFSNSPNLNPFLEQMLSRFEFYFEKSYAGVFA